MNGNTQHHHLNQLMADSEPTSTNTEPPSKPTLRHCGICNAVVDKPKVLPCLHMFCLTCLLKLSETDAEKDRSKQANVISCPSCHEDCPLPEGGVTELETSVSIDSLKQHESIQKSSHEDGQMPCTSCEEDAQAVGHCQDCGEFLCEHCLQSHKRLRKFKTHMVSPLGELPEDLVITVRKHGVCSKHVGEVLKFYCETCEEPICRDCIVVQHPLTHHKHVDIDTALQQRKTHLETLQQQSEDIPGLIDAAISEDEKIIIALETNVEQVLDQFKKTVKLAESEFAQRTQEYQASRRLEIEGHKAALQNQKSRVCAALEMNKEVIQKGIGSDLGMMYAPLSKAMATLNDLRPNSLSPSVSYIDFLPNDDLSRSLGILSGYKSWKLVKIIQSDSWGLKNPTSITYNTHDDIIVAVHQSSNSNGTMVESGSTAKSSKLDSFITSAESLFARIPWNNGSGGDIVILANDGTVKKNFRTRVVADNPSTSPLDFMNTLSTFQANPWGVATGQDGSIYVTDESRFIKVYDVNANLQRTIDFHCGHFGDGLRGLTSDCKGMLFVGHTSGYIDIVFENGGKLLSFSTGKNCSPGFITITPEGNLIYSALTDDGGPESSRVLLHKNKPTEGTSFVGKEYAFHPPSCVDVAKFKPTGVCVHEGHEMVFVANAGEAPGVYCYSLTGDYIGIVTQEVTSPQGISLRGDEQELAVCDGREIKLFQPR